MARAFVLAWVLAPLVGLSLSRHKHHHYLLHAVAPWSIYAAAGAIWAWQRFQIAPAWLRHPLAGGSLLALPAAAALFVFRDKIPGPSWMATFLAATVAVLAIMLWLGLTRRNGAIGFGIVVVLAALVLLGMDVGEGLYFDKYRDDYVFLQRSCATVPPDEHLLINADDGALSASWWMHYSKDRIKMVHNLTFLRDSRIDADHVYLIGRRKIESELRAYGLVEVVSESVHSPGETGPGQRHTLFRLRYHPDLAKIPGDVHFSPLQATTRAPGPFLTVSRQTPR